MLIHIYIYQSLIEKIIKQRSMQNIHLSYSSFDSERCRMHGFTLYFLKKSKEEHIKNLVIVSGEYVLIMSSIILSALEGE